MKRLFLFVLGALVMGTSAQAQQDTIAVWSFSDTVDFNANAGLPGNLLNAMVAGDTSGNTRVLTLTNGATDNAATATEWDNGAGFKYWMVRFRAEGYTDFMISAKLSSGGNKPGPKFWKMQVCKGGQAWEDIPGGVITAANDWTTGVVNGLSLPASYNNPDTTSIWLRWIMTSNESSSGPDVISTGVAKIDDVVVTGTHTAGMNHEIYLKEVSLYPNPAKDVLFIKADDEISSVRIFNIQGQEVFASDGQAILNGIQTGHLQAGFYFVQVSLGINSEMVSGKILIE